MLVGGGAGPQEYLIMKYNLSYTFSCKEMQFYVNLLLLNHYTILPLLCIIHKTLILRYSYKLSKVAEKSYKHIKPNLK